MDTVEKQNYQSALIRLKENVMKLLDTERHYTREENPLKESRDSGDYGKATVDLEMDLMSQEALKFVLEQIDQALKKIETCTYGVCDRCKQEICQGRLQALPYTLLCVECQEKMEKRSGK